MVGRLKGYKRALAEHGLAFGPGYVPSTTIVDGIGPAAGYDATKEFLRIYPLPEAIFCYNDFVAVGAMQAILGAGLLIPGDIALIGCGNLYFANYLKVPLNRSAERGDRRARGAAGPSIWCTQTVPNALRQFCLSRN